MLLLPIALLAGGCDRQSTAPAQPESAPASATPSAATDESAENEEFNGTLDIASRGKAMPQFSFLDPTGKRLSSADLQGKPVLINLWATWCGPCVLEMPMLDSLATKEANRLTVVTIAEDMQHEKVAAFFATRKFAKLQPWLDPDMQLSDTYATGMLPTTILYDRTGHEVWRMVGAHDWSSARTDAMLADTLVQ